MDLQDLIANVVGIALLVTLEKTPTTDHFGYSQGHKQVKVAHNQVRQVFGYEQYVPTPEDVKALKDAEQNIIEDKIDDHQLPPEVEPYEEPDDGGLDLDFEAPGELDF